MRNLNTVENNKNKEEREMREMRNQKEFYRAEKKLIFLKDLRDMNNEAIEILRDDLRNWKQLFKKKIEIREITQTEYNELEKRVEKEINEKIERLENENHKFMIEAKKINENLEEIK